VDVEQVLELLVVDLAEHLLRQHLGEADDRVERRAQLVRHVGEELRLVLVRLLELVALLRSSAKSREFWIAITAWSAKVLSSVQLLVAERLRRVARDLDRADAAAFPQHRREGDREAAAASAIARSGRRRRLGEDVAEVDDAALAIAMSVARALERPRNVPASARSGLSRRAAEPGRVHAGRRRSGRCPSPSRRTAAAAVEDLVEHRRGVGDRAADHLQHLGGRGLLLERLLGLVEQARVLDRDHRLVGEGAEQVDLLVAETRRRLGGSRTGCRRPRPSRASAR
jgi:hypothetical protein